MASRTTWPWLYLLALILLQWWLAHAIVFFTHEYAHSTVAWLLGWKASPFDLHFPPLSARVLLIQLGIDQNVNEAPIFAAGRRRSTELLRWLAVVIANRRHMGLTGGGPLPWTSRHELCG